MHGYKFDGDPDGLKFLELLDEAEIGTIIYCVDNKAEANSYDSYNKAHFEITKSADGIYMISKVAASSSSWF